MIRNMGGDENKKKHIKYEYRFFSVLRWSWAGLVWTKKNHWSGLGWAGMGFFLNMNNFINLCIFDI